MKGKHSKLWHLFFQIGVVIKAIDGFLETVGGIAFLCVNTNAVIHRIFSFTQQKLVEDPDDWIAHHLRHAFGHFSTSNKIFAATYLLGHGLVKLGLVVGMWRSKLWAFPASLAVLTGFLCYQAFRLIQHFSIGLCVLTILDIVIIVFIWIEYRRVKSEKHNTSAT